MKKILTLLVAGMLAVSGIEAKVVLEEHFGQGTETLSETSDIPSGEINSSGWTNISGSGQVYLNATDLVNEGYKDATDGSGSVEFKASFGKKVARPLSENVSNGSVYVAAILDVKAAASRDYVWAMAPDKQGLSTAGNHFARLYVQKKNNGFQFGIGKSTESPVYVSYTDELAFGKYLVVMEYRFVTGDANDIVYLYLNPAKGAKPAPTLTCKQSAKNTNGDEVGAGTKADAANVGSFLFYSSTSGKAELLADELRIATAWKNLFGEEGEEESVDPIDPDPVDPDPENPDPEQPGGEGGEKPAVGTELLKNGSFEEFSVSGNPMFGEQTSFDDWAWSAFGASADKEDKLDGEVSMHLRPTTKNGTLNQEVVMDAFEAGDQFKLTIHYKAVDLKDGTLKLDCYWVPKPGGDAEEMKKHEADILQVELANAVTDGWVEKEITTTMPQNGRYFYVRTIVSAANADVLFDRFSLIYAGNGEEEPPAEKAVITVSPSELPLFQTTAGSEQVQKISVSSEKCTDFVYLKVEHIQGSAFTIDATMMAPNSTGEVSVRFAPKEAGSYQSKVIIYTKDAEDVEVLLNGKAESSGTEEDSWANDFVWDDSAPLKLMIEGFDNVAHNKPWSGEGWQNVAAADARPWWGFDASKTQSVEGEGTFVKATAYQSGQESTGEWEMWLVTPPLDYKNAESKLFTFSVMGQYMPEEDNQAVFEVYYVDPKQPEHLRFQNLTESFAIPQTSDSNEDWQTFFLDLAPYAETVADVFHMAFRYAGPNGTDGAVTYYVDDVSWGRTDLPVISVDVTQIIDSAALNEVKIVGQINVTGKNLSAPIDVAVKGANYNKFKVSSETIPAEGGALAVGFQSDLEGVHEAYIELSSPEAATVFIPMAVLCKNTEGIDLVGGQHSPVTRKVLRNGVLLIEQGTKTYNAQGAELNRND